MSKKLFVGGLSWGTTEADLRGAFAEYGEITDVHVAVDRDTGRSRGFGFVTYADGDQADRAIDRLDGQTLDGRTLRVSAARERRPRD
ncbi:MAG: RNA-binding protein [Deltaproteobacteria bacterium]|nr:RNA-binding protein [Deltaproteobacteria bacterium]